MNKWTLPTSLNISGVDFAIRTDFRVVLGIFRYMRQEDITPTVLYGIILKALYIEADKIPQEHINEALEQAYIYMAGGRTNVNEEESKKPQLVDWEQDADILIPSINRVAGFDVRGTKVHWWTFLGYYSEIGEGTFATVVGIRAKMAKGKKLEDYEREFLRDNHDIVILKTAERKRQDEEDRAALAAIGL